MDDRCTHSRDHLSEYLDDQLSPELRQEVQAHLDSCDECRVALHQLSDMSALMKSEPSLTPPESFYQGVLARIASETPGRAGFWGWPAKTLATACVLVLIVISTREVRDRRSSSKATSVAEKQMADLVSQMKTQAPAASPAAPEPPRDQRLDKPISVPKPALNEVFSEADEERSVNKKELRRQETGDRKAALAGSGDYAQAVAQGVVVSQGLGYNQISKDQSGSPSAELPMPALAAKRRAKGDVVIGGSKAKVSELREAKIAVPTSKPWRGVVSGIHQPYSAVVKTPADWQSFWARHSQSFGTPPPLPTVDFSRDMVAAVFMGDRPSTGYGIEIVRTVQAPSFLMIEYRQIVPPPGIPQSAMVTQPYELRVLPRTDLPVLFRLLPEP